MFETSRDLGRLLAVLIAVLALNLMIAKSPALAQDDEAAADTSIDKVVTGIQGVSVDSDNDRPGRFYRYGDQPSGFVVDYLRFAHLFGKDDQSYFDLKAIDALQQDERYQVKLGVGSGFRLRFDYAAVPYVVGNGARTLLGGNQRIGNGIQQRQEDPDGNGIPFYAEPGGPGGDNALVQDYTRDLFSGATPFDLRGKSRLPDLQASYGFSSNWKFGIDYKENNMSGSQALGSGTYQRITDVNGDGRTDYDYFFSIRGVELAAPSNYTTAQTKAWVGYRQDKWFGDLRYTYSSFDNDDKSVEYDNPFWFTPTDATSGSRRGLWEFGRASQPPSNSAWNLTLSGGVDFVGNSRVTAMYNTGEHSQDDAFLPITTNTALIGTVDLNGDGVVDSRDNPTTTAILPSSNLDSKADITIWDINFTSRPLEWLKINAKWRNYSYDEGSSSIVMPGRAEYIESHMKTDFKGTSLAWVPQSYDRETIKLEGVFDFNDFRFVAFWNRLGYSWNQYESTTGNESREVGNRSVSGTDDDTLGLRVLWTGGDRFAARLDYYASSRDFNNDWRIGFSGVNEGVRQYDIAKRDRTAWEARFDYFANDRLTLGAEYRNWDDDYKDLVYGYLDGKEDGWVIDGNFMFNDSANLFIYFEGTGASTDTHLRTKCANCTPPAGADWTAPWGVPNFDWFTDYSDDTFAWGGEFSYETPDNRNRLTLSFDYLDAKVKQKSQNPGVPRDLGQPPFPPVQVALAVDFPDQTNDFTTVELRYTRQATELITWGVMYLYEDWNMDDFQLESMDSYGANFLSVDDATRYTFLNAWNGNYTAHVAQAFLKFHF